MASSVTGATTAERQRPRSRRRRRRRSPWTTRAPRRRDEGAPQQAHERAARAARARSGPATGSRATSGTDRHGGQDRGRRAVIAGAPESARTSSIGMAPRHTRTVTTTVNARLSRRTCTSSRRAASMRRSVTGAGPGLRAAYPGRVSSDDQRRRTGHHDLGERRAADGGPAHGVARPGRAGRVRRVHAHRAGATASSTSRRTRSRTARPGRRAALAAMFPGERLVLPAGHVQGARQRHRLPLPGRHRAHLLLRQPDQRRRPGRRGRRGRALRPAALGARQRRVLPRPAVRRALGRPSPVTAARSRTRSGSRCATSTTASRRCSGSGKTRVLRGVSDRRRRAGRRATSPATRTSPGSLSELRLVKDDWEVGELQEACDITTLGFEDVVREWDQRARATASAGSRAPSSGAPGRWATTSATTPSSAAGGTRRRCTGSTTPAPITPGELVLLDMGVEGGNLYTADVTRTLPVDGRFTAAPARPLRPRVRRAAGRHRRGPPRRTVPGRARRRDGRARPRPGVDLGLLPVSAEEALDPEVQGLRPLDAARHQPHARHGRARLRPRRGGHLPAAATSPRAWCSPSSPGLYFQEDDLLVPEELRGIGIRIEDDILVTADGSRNLSAALPRTADDVEEWMGDLLP